MKLLTFKESDKLRLGVKTDKGVLYVKRAAESFNVEAPKTIEAVFNGGKEALAALAALVKQALESGNDALLLDEESLKIGPAVPNPGKIICVGLNYKKHAEESNMPIPKFPVLFNKFGNSIAAHQDEIKLHWDSNENDYEAELAIVIGKEAKDVSKEEALDYVFGYCNANDLSCRDLQFRTGQWLLGKALDGYCPVGPYVVTSDEVGDPHNLTIKAIVNGEVRQNSNTGDMIFKCDEIVSYISKYVTLQPGDLILTGTPEGVAMGYPEDVRQQYYLKAGDEVTIEIEKLGRLTNTFKA